DAVRDWGFAPEYVEGMWAMLQADEPADYVLATGTAHTVEDFARLCFAHVGLDWTRHVRFDERYLRPSEVDSLIGDPSKAARDLGDDAYPRPSRAPVPGIHLRAPLGRSRKVVAPRPLRGRVTHARQHRSTPRRDAAAPFVELVLDGGEKRDEPCPRTPGPVTL